MAATERTDRSEIQRMRCLKCQKIITCSIYDTSALINHIRNDHPEVKIVNLASKKPRSTSGHSTKNCQNSTYVDEKDVLSIKSEPMPQCKCSILDPDTCRPPSVPSLSIGSDKNAQFDDEFKSVPRKKHLYRTSIERWQPGSGTIYCPRCCCCKEPLIRTSAERAASGRCGAACLLSCWPFCFLPCLIPGAELNKEYLYCSNCKNFLGLFDRENKCVRPNKEFAETCDAERAE